MINTQKMMNVKTIWEQFLKSEEEPIKFEEESLKPEEESLKSEPITFDETKKKLETTYKLVVKESSAYPSLYLIHQGPESDNNNDFVRLCNGLIVEKETNKLVCCTFPKCYENNESLEINVSDDITVQKCIEGTLVRVYYYKDNWVFSTKRSIDASHSSWLSSKSFKDLFLEIVPMEVVETFDKKYVYSFIICHHENAIVVPIEGIAESVVYLICKRDAETFEECPLGKISGRPKILLVPDEEIMSENIIEDLNKRLSTENIDCQGYIICDKSLNRQKIDSTKYNEIRELWGNNNNRLYRYLELRRATSIENNVLKKYLKHFARDFSLFAAYEEKISTLCFLTHKFYYLKFVKKEQVDIPYYLRKIIYKVHKAFLNDRVETTLEKIKILIFGEDIPLVYHALSNIIDKETESNKELEENKQTTQEQTTQTVQEQTNI